MIWFVFFLFGVLFLGNVFVVLLSVVFMLFGDLVY